MVQEMISCLVDFIIFLWFNRFYELRKHKIINIIALYLVMIATVRVSNDVGIISPNGRVIITCLYYTVATFVLYNNISVLHKLARIVIILSSIVVAEFLAMAIVLMGIDDIAYESLMDTKIYWLLFVIATKCCEIIFLNLINKVYFIKTKKVSWREIIWHFLFLGSIFGYLYTMVKAIYMNWQGRDVMEMTFWINIAFIILTLFGYYFFWKMYEEKNRQNELVERLIQKQEIQVDYYKKVIYYEKEFRKIKHDLKNQLLIIKSIKDEEILNKYKREIDNNFLVFERSIDSGNEILDILLENKKALCQKNNIKFEMNVNFRRGDFIDLIDIGVIFGNILDNAIEACLRMESLDKKIFLFVYENEDFMIVKLSNSFEKIKVKGKRLVSLKEDKKNHGIGLYSLEQTLKKYDGTFRYNIEDKEFQLNILIPIKAPN